MAHEEVKKNMQTHSLHGVDILQNPRLNKGTAFTDEERDALGLRGLLPPRVHTQEQQSMRVLRNYRRKPNEIEKYIFMAALQERNLTLFYRVLIDNLGEMLPIIYTPTVGQACQEYGQIYRRPRGLYITSQDKGRVAEILKNWPSTDVRIIVVTDGERILGVGDLGAHGMGIPVGKLSLYTACAGVDPSRALPITIDVGTDNDELLDDPLYLGIKQHRQRGQDYDELIEEFIQAVQEVFPYGLIQFEDFANNNAFRLLDKYRDRACTFNDDIQGTAAVTLSGIYSSLRVTQDKLQDQNILFFGAGEAGIGIADLFVLAMVDEGVPKEEAKRRCWFVDSKGLVVKNRNDLAEHKLAYAHEHEFEPDLMSAVNAIKPTALIGVSGQPATFTKPVLEAMATINDRPLIFALSNPTSNSECTAEDAYTCTGGRAIFASGSPFDAVTFDGQTYTPGQANNAYIFPGVGLGGIACASTRITDEMFFAAAKALAEEVSEDDLKQGSIYPPFTQIREVSASIAAAVCEVAYNRNLAKRVRPDDLKADIIAQMYEPNYADYL